MIKRRRFPWRNWRPSSATGSPSEERRAGAACALAFGLLLIGAPVAADADHGTLRAALADALAEPDTFEDRYAAEVWLVDMAHRLRHRIPDEAERIRLLRKVHQEAARVDLPPEVVLAVIQVESNFDRFAISVAGAQGLMQVMPFWLEELGRPDDNLFDLRTNLRMGCTILRHYLDRERGDLTRALARYNGSFGQTWYPERVYQALNTRWAAR
ncbi:lytic transglycosylase domain-containing protein [Ectothiorhodospiraceae bacterium 2226]|nr:lytic transglycosylase domain-containing protein [Ectothiorhodospiraceae bacterium 2226]